MKIININTPLTSRELLYHLTQDLNRLFQEQRESDLVFKIEKVDDAVEISEPEMYEGFLFRIEIKGNELWITRAADYIDDVNSLTVESILNKLFEDLAGKKGVKITQEG